MSLDENEQRRPGDLASDVLQIGYLRGALSNDEALRGILGKVLNKRA